MFFLYPSSLKKKCHNSNDFLSILDKKNSSRILSTRSDELDTNQSVLIPKKYFFQKNKVHFSRTLFPVNFFNISTLEKGGGARPSAPRRGAPGDAPAEKTCFLLIKNLMAKKNPNPKKSKKGSKISSKILDPFLRFFGFGFFLPYRFFIGKKHVFSNKSKKKYQKIVFFFRLFLTSKILTQNFDFFDFFSDFVPDLGDQF